MHVAIVYGTTDGQTREIAQRIGERLQEMEHSTLVSDIRSLSRNSSLHRADGIIVAGSLHAQGYQRRVRRFVRTQKPSAFVSVCLSIASRHERERDAARQIPQDFTAALGWRPDLIEVVAGALRFSRYGLLRRMAMKAIADKEMPEPVSPNRDYVLTDWRQVDAFAESFARLALARRRVPVGVSELASA